MTEHPIEFDFPDIARWRAGNSGTEFVHVLPSGEAGPTVMVNALTHGNEVSGAVVVDALLAMGLKPRRGTLILSFANVEAYATFNEEHPFKSRMVNEDLSHQLRGEAKKVNSVLQADVLYLHQPKICLVDQSRGLQCMVRALRPHVAPSEPP